MKTNYTSAMVLTTLLIAMMGLTLVSGCGEKAISPPPTVGPATYSGDSLYITVVDESGNPIPNADIYFTCWGPTDANDCRASISINSSPVKHDTVTSITCAPNPIIKDGSLMFENTQVQDFTVELLDYAGKRVLAELYKQSNASVGMNSVVLDVATLDSIIAKTHPQKKGISNVYRARVRYSKDTAMPSRTVFVWDRSGLMYTTNTRGYVGIAYSSLPFGEFINRITDNGTKIGVFGLQSDYLYLKCSTPGYKVEYGMVNAYDRRNRELRLTMRKE